MTSKVKDINDIDVPNISEIKAIPIGYELRPVKKRRVIELMGQRYWGRRNPLHWDPVTAHKEGLKAPAATGMMTSANITEMLVNHFSVFMFKDMHLRFDIIQPTFVDELVITKGVVKEKTPENSGFKFLLDVWAENQEGERKVQGWVEIHVP
jgi:acyl dehydratase